MADASRKNQFPDSDTRPFLQAAPTFYPNHVRFPARHSRTGRGRPHRMQRQPPNYQHGEVSKRFGSHNGLSVTQKQNTVPKEPRIVFFRDQAPGTQRVLPPPRARAAPVSLAGYPRGHGSLGRYLSAQAKNSVGRAPTRNPNHNLTPSNRKPTTNPKGGNHPPKHQLTTTAVPTLK